MAKLSLADRFVAFILTSWYLPMHLRRGSVTNLMKPLTRSLATPSLCVRYLSKRMALLPLHLRFQPTYHTRMILNHLQQCHPRLTQPTLWASPLTNSPYRTCCSILRCSFLKGRVCKWPRLFDKQLTQMGVWLVPSTRTQSSTACCRM